MDMDMDIDIDIEPTCLVNWFGASGVGCGGYGLRKLFCLNSSIGFHFLLYTQRISSDSS
jgi:hypothetical protein